MQDSARDNYLRWQEDELNEAQLQQLHKLLEQAQPDKLYISEIEKILYEELEPYFSSTT